MRSTIRAALALPAAGCLLLSACGGGGGGDSVPPPPPGSSLSVVVSGLAQNASLEVINGLGERATISANGERSFTMSVPFNGSYAVSVTRHPDGQTCSLAAGTGWATAVTAPAKVQITCAALTFPIGGQVAGLEVGESVSLLNNNGDETVVSVNGAFRFLQPVAWQGSYVVAVGKQPVGKTCTVTGGSAAGIAAAVDNIAVTCSTRYYKVSGVVDGLPANAQASLRLNGADAMVVAANGPFSFGQYVAHNGSAVATVESASPGTACSIANGNVVGVVADVENVAVHCAAITLPVSGTVSGLPSNLTLTAYLNGASPKTVGNGRFSFDTPLPFSGQFQVSLSPMTDGWYCSVNNGAGFGVTSPVTNVEILCSRESFFVGGILSGLQSGQQITLFNNGADALTLTANGGFKFPTNVTYDGSYAVSISAQPVNHVCSVGSGSGTHLVRPVTNVSVLCSRTGYTVGGRVSGLAAGRQVTLLNNGADPLTIMANGDFQMPRPVPVGGAFALTVGTEPIGQTCAITAGSGTDLRADTSAVRVSCRDGGSIGGTIKGLGALTGLVIANGDSTVAVPADASSFTLPQRVASGDAYNVTVKAQPVSQDPDVVSTVSCSVSGGAGTGSSSDQSTVQVICGGTLTFNKVGLSNWRVPSGVSQLTELVVTGAGGSSRAATGGSGATVTVTGTTVAARDLLTLQIGAAGVRSQLTGGGASGVTLQGASSPFVIAGGGGAAGDADLFGTAGSGGNADIGSGGGTGGFGSFVNSPWTTVSGGSGGAGGKRGYGGFGQFTSSGGDGSDSTDGSIVSGGIGGWGRAGNGGAGYGGGGGGGATSGVGSWAGAGGGGGGSLIPPGATAALANNPAGTGTSSGQGSVRIKY